MAERERESALSARDPFADLDWFSNWNPIRAMRLTRAGEGASPVGAVMPPVDIAENDEAYVVTMELPGIERDNVTVEVHENVLTIRGEKKSEREEKNEHRRYVERSFGSFSRSFTLPANANEGRVDARFSEGVLSVTIPKAEEAKPRTVSIGK